MFGRNTRKLLDDANRQMSRLNDTMEGFLKLQRLQEKTPVPMDEPMEEIAVAPECDAAVSRQAAYALNLCAVSISQIIDYNDLNVLEQEYDAILNNLNIEHFPKDEALLKILKQILDTVTFFRLQEGDRRFIERDYQQKMKNAIWSAVPNFGVIVASANPFVMLMSLASQVGMGYMNYRKQKAENTLEYEKERWMLQRAAMEQFNGLKRELFDTAWRLADRYNFPDEYRLTENQIHHYNAILMDPDPYRRDERLEAIEFQFKAYPQYWYHRGNTAACIATEAGKGTEIYDKYSSKAISSFRRFLDIGSSELLRTDIVTSSCCLELAGMLSPQDDRDEILGLIDKAARNSGTHNDVKQLCANCYLAMNERKLAEKYLRILVVEGYNAVSNAKLLSTLYCTDVLQGEARDVTSNYETLKRFVDERYLMPLPSGDLINGGATSEVAVSMAEDFLRTQKEILKSKYRLVIDEMDKKFTVRLNRFYQNVGRQHPDEYFYDTDQGKKQRRTDIQTYFLNPRNHDEYSRRVSSGSFQYDLISCLNEYVNALWMIKSIECDFSCIDDAVDARIERIKSIDAAILDSTFGMSTLDAMQDVSFGAITGSLRSQFISKASEYVDSISDLKGLAEAEEELNSICLKEDLSSTDNLYSLPQVLDLTVPSHSVQLRATGTYINTEAEREKDTRLRKTCEEYDFNSNKVQFITTAKEINSYKERFHDRLKRYGALITSFRQSKIIAIISTNRNSFETKDLFFTADGIFKINTHLFKKDELMMCPYGDIRFECYSGNLSFNEVCLIEQKLIDTVKLHQMILELQKA